MNVTCSVSVTGIFEFILEVVLYHLQPCTGSLRKSLVRILAAGAEVPNRIPRGSLHRVITQAIRKKAK